MLTVGRDEAVIRRYIREQEKEDERLEQLSLVQESANVGWHQEQGPCFAGGLLLEGGYRVWGGQHDSGQTVAFLKIRRR